MKNKVIVNRFNMMEAMESVVMSRGYGTVARGTMFDREGNPYCMVGSVAVEMNAETKGKFNGAMESFRQLFDDGYFEWADKVEQKVVLAVLESAMTRNDLGVTFGENLTACRAQLRDLARTYPASEAIKVIAGRVEAAHFLSTATA